MIQPHAKTAPASSRLKPLPDAMRVKAARIRLVEAETTAAAWARAHGEHPALVSKVLSGTRSCVRGDSRRIALKLDIIDGLSTDTASVACDRPGISQ